MSKDAIIIVLGLVVALMPFLGFPGSWEMVILVILGISIAVLAFLMRQEMVQGRRMSHEARSADAYVENGHSEGYETLAKNASADAHAKENQHHS